MIWRDCTNNFPKKRKDNSSLSELVLTYDRKIHSLAYYDFRRSEWKDVTVNAYISDMSGKWTYLLKPKKKIKIKLE